MLGGWFLLLRAMCLFWEYCLCRIEIIIYYYVRCVEWATLFDVLKKNPNWIEVNGLEIVLDATPLNELTAMESVVKSHQRRLLALQKAQEALETLDQAGDTEGIRYLVLEKERVPEQILLKPM